MSDIPSTNYLKNTAPEEEDRFVQTIRKIPIFANLPENLRKLIFQYSKFVPLKKGQRCIQQGMFDQEVFILIHGNLDVFLETEEGEQHIDVIRNPFSMFGERSLLGEQRGASIAAADQALLLGIDLSSLPDVLEGLDAPEYRVSDENYQQNIDMYTVFASVLTERMEGLVHDQYKLLQKVRRQVEQTSAWKRNTLLIRVFNDFYKDTIPINADTRQIFKDVLKLFEVNHTPLLSLIDSPKFTTQRFYTLMVKLQTLGELEQVEEILFSLVRRLVGYLQNSSHYAELLKYENPEIPPIKTLSSFLKELYNAINEAPMLKRPMELEAFLEAFLWEGHPNPQQLAGYLQRQQLVQDRFGLAYVMYLICQSTIYSVGGANKNIARYIECLAYFNSPRKFSYSEVDMNQELIQTLVDMHQNTQAKEGAEDVQPEAAAANNVDDLLASLGM